MPLVQHSPRIRWPVLLAAWALAGGLILWHTAIAREYIRILDAQGLRGAGPATTPLRQVIPARHADTQMWVRHVLEGRDSGLGRVRFTTVDNAPHGREVHWSSAFGWLLRGAAEVQATLRGPPAQAASFERALLWFNAPLFFAMIVLWSGWTARRAGAWAGALMALAMVGHARFREGFEPAYVDHHGLVTAMVLGLVLGAAFMGFGWWRPAAGPAGRLPGTLREAQSAAVISALAGALALWLSAASALLLIALVGIAGLAATLRAGRTAGEGGARFEPAVWRRWGRVGAGASVMCYLLEYAPDHLGWRLEVNHPLYAAAWWGGAELIALLGSAWTAERPGAGWPRVAWRRLPLPFLALAAPPLAIVLGGPATFLPGDPFVADLRHFVAESRSLPAMIREFGLDTVGYDLVSTLLLLVPAGLLLRRRDADTRLVVGALVVVMGACVVAASLVVRWWVVGSAVQIVLLLWIVATIGGSVRRRWTLAFVIAGVLLIAPTVWRIARDHGANQRRVVAALDLFQPLYRDLAATLRTTQPEGPLVLLASPNVSAGIAYFGRIRSVGTLFWENAAGLRAAAEMFSASTDEEARRLIQARGITHIVMLSAAPFVAEYFALLHPLRPRDEAKGTFGHRLLGNPAAVPRWLQPVPYRPPAELMGAGGVASIYKVVTPQTEDVHLFHAGVVLAARGETAAAEEAFLSALALVPAKARASLCGFAGESVYEHGAHALAVRMLRRALQAGDDAGVANLAAWILATSVDPAVRDGAAALALVRPLARESPGDPVVASTLAAAYAELGRFEEAVQAAERAMAAARAAGGDQRTQTLLAERIEAYRARHPWRQ